MSLVLIFSTALSILVYANASEAIVSPAERVAFSCVVNDKVQVQGQINVSENSGSMYGSFYSMHTPIAQRAFFHEENVVGYAERGDGAWYRIFFPRLTYLDKAGWSREVELNVTFNQAESTSICFARNKLVCIVNGMQSGCGEIR